MVFICLVVDWEYLFWISLVQKVKIVYDEIWQGKFDGDVHFFCSGPKITFLGKFDRKS